MENPHLFCFGLGYTGTRLAQRLLGEGWRVSGTCREQGGADAFRSRGVEAHTFSGDASPKDDIIGALQDATHVLNSVPPGPETGDPVFNAFGNHMAPLKHLVWLGYLSTTGVYGNTDGAVVDETTPANPSGERARRRVTAEQNWMSLFENAQVPVHVFRLPGIYGPGRSSFDQIRHGNLRRIDKPGHLFNRIHVDDIVETLTASMKQPNPGRVYNVCDDEPATPAAITTYACSLLGMTPPPAIPFEEAQADMSDMALSFWKDNRRVSNVRIRQELGVSLTYPTYREGLDAIYRQESGA